MNRQRHTAVPLSVVLEKESLSTTRPRLSPACVRAAQDMGRWLSPAAYDISYASHVSYAVHDEVHNRSVFFIDIGI